MTQELVFDRDDAMQRVDNDVDLYKDLVQTFFEDYPASLKSLQTAAAVKSQTELQSIAHSLKSALGNLGAMRSYKLAQSVELAARAGNVTESIGHLSAFVAAVEEFRKEVSAQFGMLG